MQSSANARSLAGLLSLSTSACPDIAGAACVYGIFSMNDRREGGLCRHWRACDHWSVGRRSPPVGQLQQVVGGADEAPLGGNFFDAA